MSLENRQRQCPDTRSVCMEGLCQGARCRRLGGWDTVARPDEDTSCYVCGGPADRWSTPRTHSRHDCCLLPCCHEHEDEP